MASSRKCPRPFIIDALHGDIHLEERECQVVDTASFQRLRYIKQLQMGHVTYPNATHTRFVHSLGTLQIMRRVLAVAQEHEIELDEDARENLCLAALLHDIGHYPYSHLLEGVGTVHLLEERVRREPATEKRKLVLAPYPDHVSLGALIVTTQQDVIDAIGGEAKAKQVADLFSGQEVEKSKLSKLVSSSLDLDRLDYLQRDSYATGLPYGRVDLNYLLNSLRGNSEGDIGVHERAIPAVEHFLLARFFMYRTVYFHRTTVAIEEACRQLLKRLRDAGKYGVPPDGETIKAMVASNDLHTFTDAYVDAIVGQAVSDSDDVISSLASSIRSRNPPKLLKEVCVLEDGRDDVHCGSVFKGRCFRELADVADRRGIPLGRFLFCELPVGLEKQVSRYTASEYDRASTEEIKRGIREESGLVRIFMEGDSSPKSLLEIPYSIIRKLAGHVFRMYRLYFVEGRNNASSPVEELRSLVADWDRP